MQCYGWNFSVKWLLKQLTRYVCWRFFCIVFFFTSIAIVSCNCQSFYIHCSAFVRGGGGNDVICDGFTFLQSFSAHLKKIYIQRNIKTYKVKNTQMIVNCRCRIFVGVICYSVQHKTIPAEFQRIVVCLRLQTLKLSVDLHTILRSLTEMYE